MQGNSQRVDDSINEKDWYIGIRQTTEHTLPAVQALKPYLKRRLPGSSDMLSIKFSFNLNRASSRDFASLNPLHPSQFNTSFTLEHLKRGIHLLKPGVTKRWVTISVLFVSSAVA